MINGFLIDPDTRSIKAVNLTDDYGLEEIYELLGCQTFDIARIKENSLFVDDEGLFKNPEFFQFWKPEGDYPRVIAGRGLLLGPPDEEGKTTSVTMSEKEVIDMVKICNAAAARELAIEHGL